ncbi:MAG: diacylglycerol kinase [Gammaproteobacteria bacterium SG8_11]|nr:MAG: diacylglycerol kinase [Gammaproteobacteria bacterium SG8_11]
MNKYTNRFSLTARICSIKYAIAGIAGLLKEQHNAWVHVLATATVVALAFYYAITPVEWSVLILAITAVFVAEALNTALEYICDVVSPEFHPLVKKSKDIAAGAVLITAISAVIIGLVIFLPYINK